MNNNTEATWVPTLEETELLVQALTAANFYNVNKSRIKNLGQGIEEDNQTDQYYN